MKDKLRVVSAQVPELASELRTFHARTKDVSNELDIVQSACQKENLVWELLSLPSGIADKLVEARSFLLEELFNKFSGPLDLASSIQVVNNVRKMPYLTPTQLRACILQHRDMYLDRQILDITVCFFWNRN
ncbi:hypothetical protein TELCIR_12253 [Teladorsagia circumcincta]|uniref:Uncharacterized protein n=1 Tax=Teladorsagia circumcincta TaxID=45464 RepID=A0A2G9U722_TELCI|nr:hypothetical protein TELCIR_12253 [Teladorsagia circumcincta]